MKEMRDDRVHARMALVRDLFGLSDEDELAALDADGVASAPSRAPSGSPRCARCRRGSRRRRA